jgi:hypothetical protein
MPAEAYNIAKGRLGTGLPWVTAPLRVFLFAPSYVFSPHHRMVASVQEHETTGLLYERQDLLGRYVEVDEDEGRARLHAAPTRFTFSGTAAGAAIYLRTEPSDDGVLLCYFGFAPVTVSGGDFVVRWAPEGVLTIT